MSSRPSHAWLTPEGEPVSCLEKLKVLEQNLQEFAEQAQDILEDAALMGCDVEQVRGALAERLAEVQVRYSNSK
ncbi:MAG: hypothetical protein NVV74_12825 [Magnetospirillum sp.]|nr:hypothetical protein [Magnetospirillum sp.]